MIIQQIEVIVCKFPPNPYNFNFDIFKLLNDYLCLVNNIYFIMENGCVITIIALRFC
jgi:hypothetical protein